MRKQEGRDWIKELNSLDPAIYTLPVSNWQELYHLVVIPFYKENADILRETILSVLKSSYPKDHVIMLLAAEERAGEQAKEAVQILLREFEKEFYWFGATFHPANLSQDIPGKGSNETWAAKQIKENLIDKRGIPYQNIIISSLDADTILYPGYFACLTYKFLTTQKPLRTSFQPIPLFLNNIWQAPSISRIFGFSSTFWNMMNQERPEKLITFSTHSMSFNALVDVGFKQTNVVSDDSRIFWQCFFKYDGDYKVEPLHYPVSMDANVAPTFIQTLINMYKQQRRWAYGAADIPYFLFGFFKNKKIKLVKKMSLGFELISGHWSWATGSILLFSLGWLLLFFGGDNFSQTVLAYNIPRLTSNILTVSMIGLLFSIYLSILLLPPRPKGYGKFKLFIFILQWFLFPLSLIFFALPALEAQTRLLLGKYLGFWPTPKWRGSESN